jgi:hypothetical protein
MHAKRQKKSLVKDKEQADKERNASWIPRVTLQDVCRISLVARGDGMVAPERTPNWSLSWKVSTRRDPVTITQVFNRSAQGCAPQRENVLVLLLFGLNRHTPQLSPHVHLQLRNLSAKSSDSDIPNSIEKVLFNSRNRADQVPRKEIVVASAHGRVDISPCTPELTPFYHLRWVQLVDIVSR